MSQRGIFALLLLVWLLGFYLSTTSAEPHCPLATTMPTASKILCVGDSLTQTGWRGWVGKLADVYQRRADVVNRGMSGYNTRWYLKFAESSDVWKQQDVRLITIFFGANDASDSELNARHHVPMEEYKENLIKLIQLCQEHYPDASMLIITPPPVVHSQRLQYQKERYGDKATGKLERNLTLSKAYAGVALDVASQYKLPSVYLWQLMQEAGDHWESFFNDGLHFTSQGHEFVGQAILDEIRKSYPDLAVSPDPATGQWANSGTSCASLPTPGPYHDQIDHTNPSAAFGN